VSDQMAQVLLDIQKNYGSDYIKQRLANLKQADPEGYAGRKQLFDKIIQDSELKPDRPIATELQTQVNDILKNSGNLDQQSLQDVQQGVRAGQVSRGIYLGNAPAAQEAKAVVQTSDALKAQQQGAAQQYLNSGISPEDVEYRRIQQSLSNLGSAINGVTPEAQFGSLSGAQNGAAPFNPVNYSTPANLNSMNQAASTGINFSNSLYQSQQNQANPWTAAAGFLTAGADAANQAGWFKPSVQPVQPVAFNNFSYTQPVSAAVGYNSPGISLNSINPII